MTDLIGQQFGNYRLIRLLGHGGFAEVYLGEHVQIGKQVAIKLLHAYMANDKMKEDFRKEANIIADLEHRHIVQLLDFGIDNNNPFLIMAYAPHGNLRHHHPEGTRLSIKIIVDYVKQITDALQYAHDKKVIHRDIKPANMLIGRNNDILLSDFGIALIIENTLSQSTQSFAGTWIYVAPEQIQGKPHRASDQYALGITIYEWICGDPPFKGTYHELMYKHLHELPPPLREKVPEVSPAVEEVVLRALEKNPKNRFESVQAFAKALENAYQQAKPKQAEPTKLKESNFIIPKNADAWYEKGFTLMELGKYDEALGAFNRSLQLNPDYADAWYEKGRALTELGKYDEALDAFNHAIELDPNRAKAWYEKGFVLVELGKYDEALDALNRSLQLNPNDADAWYEKGFVLTTLNQHDEALIAFNHAIEPDRNITEEISTDSR